jgi:predicted acyltransferase
MALPVPGFGVGQLDPIGNLPAWVDRAVIGTAHMWKYGTAPGFGVAYDPEGLLSTIPALVTVLLGLLAGEWVLQPASEGSRSGALAVAGALLLVLGFALDPWLPINKKLWTSTFVLWSGGVSLLTLASVHAIVEIAGWRAWNIPLRVFGTNALFAFVISSLVTASFDAIHIYEGSVAVSIHQHVYRTAFATWLAPVNASLAYAVAIVVLNGAVLFPLYRRKIFIRL